MISIAIPIMSYESINCEVIGSEFVVSDLPDLIQIGGGREGGVNWSTKRKLKKKKTIRKNIKL